MESRRETPGLNSLLQMNFISHPLLHFPIYLFIFGDSHTWQQNEKTVNSHPTAPISHSCLFWCSVAMANGCHTHPHARKTSQLGFLHAALLSETIQLCAFAKSIIKMFPPLVPCFLPTSFWHMNTGPFLVM